jgi:diguanylate cyclase (GGDEF)-like protein
MGDRRSGSGPITDDLRPSADPLSGVLSRDGFLAVAERRVSIDRNTPSALLEIRIDDFSEIKDRHGSECGDMVIRGVAQGLLGVVREGDVVGRIDKETFIALLCRIDVSAAREIGERLRREVQSMAFFANDGSAIPVTASLGLEVLDRQGLGEKADLAAALARADTRLHQAMQDGANRVVSAERPSE